MVYDIARRQTLRDFVQIRILHSKIINGRLPFSELCMALYAFQRRDAVNAYHAAVHPRALRPTIKSDGVLPPADRIGVNIGHKEEGRFGHKPNT